MPFKKLSLIPALLLIAACTDQQPELITDNSGITQIAPQNQDQQQEEGQTETTPGESSLQTQLPSGHVENNDLGFETSSLKTAKELEELLNNGNNSSTSTAQKGVGSDGYYYYDYYSYYDDYYYDYYYYDYFDSYYNYRYRSPVYVWDAYFWPSGYGTVTCYAQNYYGDLYYGFGFPPSMAEESALDACYYDGSGYCYSIGCR